MGTKGTWNDNLHPYIQKSDGTFEANKTLISYNNWLGAYGAGAVLIANVFGDSRPEIIRADYGINPSYPSPRYSFAIFSYNTQTNKYEYIKGPARLEYTFNDLQFREFEVGDIDGDGWQDIILNPINGNLCKSTYSGSGELYLHNLIWKNNKGTFEKLSKEQKITFTQLPTYLKSFIINNKLKFIGIIANSDGSVIITEINPVF